jgi:hypothetical protein
MTFLPYRRVGPSASASQTSPVINYYGGNRHLPVVELQEAA